MRTPKHGAHTFKYIRHLGRFLRNSGRIGRLPGQFRQDAAPDDDDVCKFGKSRAKKDVNRPSRR
jgi:hypothetical protein